MLQASSGKSVQQSILSPRLVPLKVFWTPKRSFVQSLRLGKQGICCERKQEQRHTFCRLFTRAFSSRSCKPNILSSSSLLANVASSSPHCKEGGTESVRSSYVVPNALKQQKLLASPDKEVVFAGLAGSKDKNAPSLSPPVVSVLAGTLAAWRDR